MTSPPDYTLDQRAGSRAATLQGVLRLETTQAYERLFAPLRAEMTASTEGYTLDVSRVVFMNSSGIHALAGLVLAAKHAGLPLRLVSHAESAWQKKTIASLRLLYPRLEIERTSGPPLPEP